jgi:hypothetical protein
MPKHGIQRLGQAGTGRFEFDPVSHGETPQDSAAFGSEADPDFATVLLAGMAFDQAGMLHPVHQLDRAVMLDEQPRCDFADSRVGILRQAVDGEQSLMLLRLDAVFLRGGLAEMQEASDLAPKLGKIAITVGG